MFLSTKQHIRMISIFERILTLTVEPALTCSLYLCDCDILVNQLSAMESWRSLAITVCVYVLLKFLQGGGVGEAWHSKWYCKDAFKHYCLFYSVSLSPQGHQGLSVTCVTSCGLMSSSTPAAWCRSVCSLTCMVSLYAGTWAAAPGMSYAALTVEPPQSTTC